MSQILSIKLKRENGTLVRGFNDKGTIISLIYRRVKDEDQGIWLIDFIDPYGDTIFNIAQMERLLKELPYLLDEARNETETEAVNRLIKLVEEGCRGIHLYLWLIGD
jgi:hypothetical protein